MSMSGRSLGKSVTRLLGSNIQYYVLCLGIVLEKYCRQAELLGVFLDVFLGFRHLLPILK